MFFQGRLGKERGYILKHLTLKKFNC